MYSFLVSILIGIGVVLPGVSGSAIAILVGIYDKVLIVLNDSGIKPSKKIIILFPVIIGIMVGVVIFGNILLKIYEYYEFQMKYIHYKTGFFHNYNRHAVHHDESVRRRYNGFRENHPLSGLLFPPPGRLRPFLR